MQFELKPLYRQSFFYETIRMRNGFEWQGQNWRKSWALFNTISRKPINKRVWKQVSGLSKAGCAGEYSLLSWPIIACIFTEIKRRFYFLGFVLGALNRRFSEKTRLARVQLLVVSASSWAEKYEALSNARCQEVWDRHWAIISVRPLENLSLTCLKSSSGRGNARPAAQNIEGVLAG